MAGVLPYAKQIVNNRTNLYFLFARETLDIKEKTDSMGLWSDFGGSKEKGETSLETAVREGYEETSGFFGSPSKLKNQLQKTNIKYVSKTKYNCFFMRVPYNKNLPNYLENNYKFIKKTQPHLIHKHNGFFEKDKFAWIEYNDLRKNIYLFRPFYKDVVYYILKNKDIF